MFTLTSFQPISDNYVEHLHSTTSQKGVDLIGALSHIDIRANDEFDRTVNPYLFHRQSRLQTIMLIPLVSDMHDNLENAAENFSYTIRH